MNNDNNGINKDQRKLTQTYEALKSFDPVQEAEEFLGRSIPSMEDGLVMLRMNRFHSRMKEHVLNEMADTTFCMEFEPYVDQAKKLGFEVAYTEQFLHFNTDNQPVEDRDETMMILGHRELGLVLVVDSFTWESGNKNRNTSHLYFTWKPFLSDDESRHGSYNHDALSSGGWESSEEGWRHKDDNDRSQMFWSGHNDVREGLRYQINKLATAGTTFAKWPPHRVSGFLFTNWGDFKVHKLSGINTYDLIHQIEYKRFMRCPQWFQEILNGNFKQKEKKV